ncbi:right-handed parallel beta-helix repeat-containing protein [Pedobacter glucosidilyticus]|uniref:right-handed parallel beta-helix repeat-containing protein n=1 Tax=Pedobacter glucosidilyticus TaxID=1122941 RepID=UPI0004287DEB|nr:right-handed parallel beta-helix repeat-containing protein [Pedobacter glucosidilyticus]
MKPLLIFSIIILFFFKAAQADIVKYVAPKGTGKGTQISDPADFLNPDFWESIQKQLAKESITIKFLAGDYVRAFIEKPLLLKNMGHSKNKLILEGESQKTIFSVPVGYPKKPVLIDVINAQNISFKNFNFTGDGSLGYALRITSTKGNTTKNILVENCSWMDMRGIIYGATGAHQEGTSHITYKNCVFKRIGVDSHSHFMYHSYWASHIKVLNCYFEDCTGDYVRFRAHCDYGTVQNSTFVRTSSFPVYAFISVPLFNDVDPGDETFATHYNFTNNSFTNTQDAIAFHHYGYNPKQKNYLLTAAEAELLNNGKMADKREILAKNFDINTDNILIKENKTTQVKRTVVMGSFARYGATSKGWTGFADISELFK